MTTTHDQHDADRELDALLRTATTPAAAELSSSDARSRELAARRLHAAVADERGGRIPFGLGTPRRAVRRLPVLAAAGGLAAAVLVAGALAPFGGSGDDARAPFAPADASAAEVLSAAAETLDAASGAGLDGSAWHAVSRSSYGDVNESWYDPEAGTARWASASGDSYYVLDVTGDGTTTIRQYQRGAGGTWTPLGQGSQIDDPAGAAGAPGGPEPAALEWLRAVDAARDVDELQAANRRFAELTSWVFSPPAAPGTDAAANARAMQVLFLLRIAQVRPEAVAQLYRDLVGLDTLERLEGGRFDGREVVRLRLFEPPTGLGGETLEAVLLLDAETGRPLGTENEEGTRRSEFRAPGRVAEVGVDAASCGTADLPPCELLEGRGAIAAAADRIAAKAAADAAAMSGEFGAPPAGVAVSPVPAPATGVALAPSPAAGSVASPVPSGMAAAPSAG